MEITIGIQNLPREVTVEVEGSAESVRSAVDKALADGTPLALTDGKGRQIVIPSGAIGYVEIGAEAQRRVGFGA